MIKTLVMKNLKKVQISLSILALSALLSSVSDVQADTVVLANGQTYSGVKIIQATHESVSYQQGKGSPQRLNAGLVAELIRDSGYLNKIRAALKAGKRKDALTHIKNAEGFGTASEKAEAAYLKGELYLSAGSKYSKQAIDAFGAYLKKFSGEKDFFVPHATFGLGSAYLLGNKPSDAKSQFQKLEKFGGRDGIWGFKAKIGLARAIVGTKQNLLDARRVLLDVVKGRGVPQTVKEEALVLRARVFNLQEQFKQASDLLAKDFFADTSRTYNQFYAEACIEMGDSYRGRKGKSNLQEAELWYLKATLFGKNYPNARRMAAKSLADVYKGLGLNDRAAQWEKRASS